MMVESPDVRGGRFGQGSPILDDAQDWVGQCKLHAAEGSKMADPHVITALVKRRAELAGKIEAAHEGLRKMIVDLENLDATIVQFDPDYQVEAIRPKAFRPPKDWSNRGEMTRIILSILRQAAEPLTTRDIALQLLTERALDRNDLRLLRLMTKRVGVALRGQRGTLRSTQGPGQYMLWEVDRPPY